MGITGNLRTMQLSELLQWLSMGQKTGTLVIRGAPGEKSIYFESGRIISSSSSIERERLGSFLVAYGFISEEELSRAMEVQEESKILLGKILVTIGAISEEELSDLIRLKAAETIYDVFLWSEGAFHFIDGELPTWPMIPISVDVTGVVMEGLRRFDEWQRIATKIRSVREVPAIVAPLPLSSLPERERLVLTAIDGTCSIEEIALSTHNPEFNVAKFVFELLESGHAVVTGEKRIEPPASSELTPEDPYEAVFEEATIPPYAVGPEPAPEFDLPAREAPGKPSSKDFSRFLRRAPEVPAEKEERLAESGRFVAPPPPSRVEKATPPSPVSTSFPAVESPRSVSSMISPVAIPTLTKQMDELMSWSFTPNEAFIVSRINGLWDVRSIAKISPFPEGEVLRVFEKLHEGGLIRWR